MNSVNYHKYLGLKYGPSKKWLPNSAVGDIIIASKTRATTIPTKRQINLQHYKVKIPISKNLLMGSFGIGIANMVVPYLVMLYKNEYHI